MIILKVASRKGKFIIKFFLTLLYFFLLTLIPSAFAEIHTTQDLSVIYYNVDGNTSQSFYPDNNAKYLYEGSINFKDDIFKDSEVFGFIGYRATSDRLVDYHNFSIEKVYMGLKDTTKEFLIGDFYSDFSEYSLANALKGVRLHFGNEKTSRLTILAGLDTAKWEDLWESRQEDSASRRYVFGARLENNLFNNALMLNFNYGSAIDDKSYTSSSSLPIHVNVFSVDGKYKINQYLGALLEVAQGFTDGDIRKSDIKIKSDRAYKFTFDLNTQEYSLTSAYSRVGKHFNTTGGFAAQDLEAIAVDGLWFLPLKTKFIHYLHMDKDNLSKSAATTTRQINPGAKFSFALPADLTLDLGTDLRKRYASDKSTNEKTYTYTSDLTRDFKIFYSTLAYTRTAVVDRINASQERNTDTYSLSLDGNFDIRGVRFFWNLAESIEDIKYKEVSKADFTVATDLGLRIILPSSLTFEAKASLSDNDYYLNDVDSNTAKYHFAMSRQLTKDLLFNFSYERSGYTYFGGNNNYADTILQARLRYIF